MSGEVLILCKPCLNEKLKKRFKLEDEAVRFFSVISEAIESFKKKKPNFIVVDTENFERGRIIFSRLIKKMETRTTTIVDYNES
ncbi:MAG: hypothetical protein WA055_02780 [Candidatus Moraniibacteriota bacterium]